MARRWPRLRPSSMAARFSRATDPWCASASSSPAESLIAAATRSARRRLFTKTRVERCARISSTRRAWMLGHELVGSGGASADARLGVPVSTTSRSSLRAPASTIAAGRGRPSEKPASRRATSSSGRCVALSPMRCNGGACPGLRASRRSSDSARWAPRLVETRAWISSTMTVSTEESVSRAADVRSKYSDSGVVMSTSAGLRAMRARTEGGVSPVRTSTVGTYTGRPAWPARSACRAIPSSGALRLRSTSAASALSGET